MYAKSNQTIFITMYIFARHLRPVPEYLSTTPHLLLNFLPSTYTTLNIPINGIYIVTLSKGRQLRRMIFMHQQQKLIIIKNIYSTCSILTNIFFMNVLNELLRP